MEFKFLPNLFRRRRAKENSPIAHAISGSAAATAGMYGSVFSTGSGGWDVQRAVNEGLERVLWVFRCCDVIAGNQSKLTMLLREGDPDEGRTKHDDRVHRLLNRRPNIHETAQDFRYRLSIQLLLSKRGAFIEVVPDRFGRPKALELLPPHLVEPIPDAETFVSGYRLLNQVSLEEVILPKERVIWVRLKPHPIDPYLQLTPLTAAGLIVDGDWLARLFNRNFLLNDGRPGMLVAIRGHLNQIDAEEIKRRFNGGPTNAGRTTVVEADDVNAQDMSGTPRDMQYLEMLRGSKEDILLAFGVPESIIGNASGRTYDNADAEKEIFWEETMVPHCDALCRGLDPMTGDVNDDIFVCMDYDEVDVLQRRKRARHDKLLDELKEGVITIDDYMVGVGRKAWNVPGTRVLYLPNGIIVGKTKEDTEAAAKLPIVGQPPMGEGYPGGLPPLGGQGGPPIRAQAEQGEPQFGPPEEKSLHSRMARLRELAASPTIALPAAPYSVDRRIYGQDEDGTALEGDLLTPRRRARRRA